MIEVLSQLRSLFPFNLNLCYSNKNLRPISSKYFNHNQQPVTLKWPQNELESLYHLKRFRYTCLKSQKKKKLK